MLLIASILLVALVCYLLGLQPPGGICGDCGRRIRRAPIAVWDRGGKRVHVRCITKREESK